MELEVFQSGGQQVFKQEAKVKMAEYLLKNKEEEWRELKEK
jgi:hypothetical protein